MATMVGSQSPNTSLGVDPPSNKLTSLSPSHPIHHLIIKILLHDPLISRLEMVEVAEKPERGLEEGKKDMVAVTAPPARKAGVFRFNHIDSRTGVDESVLPKIKWRITLTTEHHQIIMFKAKINALMPFRPFAIKLHDLSTNQTRGTSECCGK